MGSAACAQYCGTTGPQLNQLPTTTTSTAAEQHHVLGLPYTGEDVIFIIIVALVLIAVGLGIRYVAQRRA